MRRLREWFSPGENYRMRAVNPEDTARLRRLLMHRPDATDEDFEPFPVMFSPPHRRP
jgi:hypothetical protein